MTREDILRRLQDISRMLADTSTDVALDGHTLKGRVIPAHPPEPILIFDVYVHKGDVAFYAGAYDMVAFLLDLVSRYQLQLRKLKAEIDRHDPPPATPKDYAAECAMKCGERGFQTWLHEVHGLDHPDAQRAATKVRGLLAIDSRTSLNTDPEAAERWRQMVRDYEAWRKT